MSPLNMFMCMMLVVFLLNNYKVRGTGRSSISHEQMKENLELQRQLKILNKSPVKTIQTTEGNTFDCIDIHKQPAFENPLLRSHKIQMRPSFSSTRLTKERELSLSKRKKPLIDVLKRLNCPQGTVPIRRTTEEELIRFMSFSKSMEYSNNVIRPPTTYTPGVHLAYWRTVDGATKILHGAKGDINTANPTVANNQYSGAQIWIEAGSFEDLDTIQAGWAVAPSLYGDNQTHVTTYWRGHGKNGCYNILCPGFIQVDKHYALGDVVPFSRYGDPDQIVVPMYIYQDKGTGDWWLQGGSQERNIGYWPKQLFSHLVNGATRVAWGGIVKGTPNGPSPPMGNGHFPHHSYKKAAYVTDLKVLTEHYDLVNSVEYHDLQGFVESKCYQLEYDMYTGKRHEILILFGGPGGNNCGI